jgi:hypothetical protein
VRGGDRKVRRKRGAIGLFCLFAAALGLGSSAAGPAGASVSQVFSASVSATTTSLRVVSSGAPGTDTPVDGGGPTAQVAVDSGGSSTAYAAFPDPGGLVLSGPGLVVGLLAGGAGGLPPIRLPSPPAYPFYVASDAGGVPEQSAGNGPYHISARSEATAGSATATGGFRSELAGNVALTTAESSIGSTAEGLTARATSDTQGVAIGPLTIGEIRSTATQILGRDGGVTPSTSLAISGLKVGTLPVAVTGDGVVVGGAPTPLPLNETMAKLLAPSRITFEVLSAQTFPGKVVAPAVRITIPVPISADNAGGTTLSLVLGGATAALSASATDEPSAPDVNVGDSPASPVSGSAVPTPAQPAGPVVGGRESVVPTGDELPATAPPGSSGSDEDVTHGAGNVLPSDQQAALPRPAAMLSQSPPLFDFDWLYLVVGIGAVAALLPVVSGRPRGARR